MVFNLVKFVLFEDYPNYEFLVPLEFKNGFSINRLLKAYATIYPTHNEVRKHKFKECLSCQFRTLSSGELVPAIQLREQATLEQLYPREDENCPDCSINCKAHVVYYCIGKKFFVHSEHETALDFDLLNYTGFVDG